DKNHSGRGIKPFVVGRKNWLFNNTEKGAKASSIIFSIIETCKANELNSHNYLRYLFANIHKAQTKQDLRSILPYNIDPGFLNP
ncbi:MAG: transposase domain-containing protein, partial [Candidatus Megaira endosymbiont of Carteria cerasiformis]|nr:transposase domain-containing protein [Candidatus Megaera polyxenophila]